MSKRVVVTEKLRKEIRIKIAELTPGYRWHVIARNERTSVEQAFLRIDKDDKAEVFSDDAVTREMYSLSVGRKLMADRTVEWLNENNLWTGSKFHKVEEEEEAGK